MKTSVTTFAALATLLAVSPALADNPTATDQSNYEAKSNGGYTATQKSQATDANGTTTTRESTKNVNVDDKGNTTTKVDVKDTTDPKGLMNKQTNETQNTATENNGKTEYTHKKTVNGTTVEKSDDMQKPAQ